MRETLQGINHLACITNDLEKTVRFYRDLLGMELFLGKGVAGFRHFIFRLGPNQIAFFEYPDAKPWEERPQGERIGFDHVSFTVADKTALFRFRDRLNAAGFTVSEVLDYGMVWSFHTHDPSGLPIEISWDCIEVLETPAIDDEEPLAVAAEGAGPQPGIWPEPQEWTQREAMVAKPGRGQKIRTRFLREGKAKARPELVAAAD